MKRILFTLVFVLAAVPVFAQNTSTTQMQLTTAAAQRFIDRVAYLLTQQAVVVKAEALATACHAARSTFASQVIAAPQTSAQASAVLLAGSTNVIGTVTVSGSGLVDSSASDAALLSQIATSWNALSKCDTGS